MGEVGLGATVGLEERVGWNPSISLKQRQPPRGGSKGAGDGDDVAGLGGVAGHGRTLDGADEGDGYEGGGGLDHVAADDVEVAFVSHRQHSVVEGVNGVKGEVRGQAEGDEGVEGLPAHRGHVADIDGHDLPTHVLPREGVAGEVDAFDHRVGGEEVGTGGAAPNRGVVARVYQKRADGRRGSRLAAGQDAAGEAVDDAEFSDAGDFGGGGIHGSRIVDARGCGFQGVV